MLTPLAPSNAVPLRFTDPALVVVTVEPFAAIEPPTGAVAPAVSLSICVSVIGCAFLVVVEVL
jgi:hypothetical protein